MQPRKLSATVRSRTRLHDGFLKLDRYEFETDKHEGGTALLVREMVERCPAVAVLAYDPNRDEVILINEFRPGCLIAGDEAFTDNLVAGGVTQGESIIEAAVREMKEEANLDLRDPVIVHPGAYVSSGGISEKIAIVAGSVDATLAGGVHGNADEAEDILTVVLPAQSFIDRVRSAQVTDLKTMVAGYWLAEHRERLRWAVARA